MSTGAAAAVLYACTTSAPGRLGSVPEDVEEKTHHLRDGKGNLTFRNPWESWKMASPPTITWAMIK